MSQSTDRQFLELYRKHRYEDQVTFYQKREKAFTEAQKQATFISTSLMLLTALAGALEAIEVPWLRFVFMFIAAIAPVFYTSFTSYYALYAFDRQARLYRDTLTKLRYTRALMPDVTPEVSEREFTNQLNKYIDEVERVLRVEQEQWEELATRMRPDYGPYSL